MPLAFCASQQLQLDVSHQPERLAAYLSDQDRVVKACWIPTSSSPLAQVAIATR